MQQQNNRQFGRTRQGRQGPLPWIVIGIAVLIALGVVIFSSLRHRAPPQPIGPARQSRVHLIVQSNIGGAGVYLNGQQKAVTSNTHHKAKLFNLAPKTYQITLKKHGYTDRTKTVEITGEALSQTVEIDLTPNGMGQ